MADNDPTVSSNPFGDSIPPDFSLLDGPPSNETPEPAPQPELTPNPEPAPAPAQTKPAGTPEVVEPKAPPAGPANAGASLPQPDNSKAPAPGAKTQGKGAAKAPDVNPPATDPNPDDIIKDLESIQPRAGSHPKIQDDFKRLKDVVKTERIEKQALQAEIEKLKTAAPLEPSEEAKTLKERVNQLELYEMLLNPEHSEMFKREHDQKIETVQDSIVGLLVAAGMPKEAKFAEDPETKVKTELMSADLIKRAGIAAFPYEWWDQNIISKLPALQREQAKVAFLDYHKALTARDSAMADMPKRKDELVKTLTEQRQKESQAGVDLANKRVQELVASTPYGAKKAIPQNSTPEEKAEIEELNAFHDEAIKLFPKLMNPKTPKDLVDIAAGMIEGLYLEKQVAKKDAQIGKLLAQVEELQATAGKMRTAGRTATRQPSQTAPAPKVGGEFTKSADEAFASIS